MDLQKTLASNTLLSSPLGGLRMPALSGPQTGLAFLLLFQLIFWTLIPIIGHHTPPLDVIEMHTWASVPQLGYYKHPPLPAWGIYVSEAIFGRTGLALFVPSALSIAVATWAVWPLALRFFGARRALIALFLQSAVAYYHLYSPDYNHNVAQMPFWALTVTAFYFALNDGRARWWMAFGVAMGATTLSKYSAVFLPMACTALLLCDRASRRHVSVRNVLAAAAGFFACFGPHLIWLVQHDFAPIHYIGNRLGDLAATASWGERFSSYVAMQVMVHFVLLATGFIVAFRARKEVMPAAPNPAMTIASNRRFLWVMGCAPFAATLVIGLAGGYLHPMWASAMFPLSGLIAVHLLGARADRLFAWRWFNVWLALMLLFGTIYAIKNAPTWHSMTGKHARAAYPGPELASQLDSRWRAAFPQLPLRYIIGSPWEAGVASFESSYDTEVLIDGDFELSRWITPSSIKRCGAIAVWNPAHDMLPTLLARFPGTLAQAPLVLEPQRAGTYQKLSVPWALIAPTSPPFSAARASCLTHKKSGA